MLFGGASPQVRLFLSDMRKSNELSCSLWVGSFSVRAVYEELSNTLTAIDEQEDLRWWRNAHGPGMPTDWPHFQVGVQTSDPSEQSDPLEPDLCFL